MAILNDPNKNLNQPMVETNEPGQNRQRGSGFTNINRILGANVGAGQQLAGKIGGAISGQGQRVRQGLGQAQQQFQTGFQQARQEALANVESAGNLAKGQNESDEDYAKRLANQNIDYSKIGQNLRGASYQGPTGFENPNVLLSQAQTAGKLGAFTRSGLGQGILARQYGAGRGSYGAGQGALDQLFLSQDPTAQRMLQQSRQDVTGLGKQIQEAASSAQQTAQTAQSSIDTKKSKALTDISQSLKGIQDRGAEAAKQFYADRDRFNTLMLANKTINSEGIPVFKDRSGNIINVTAKDMDLIANPEKFGLQGSEIMVYPGGQYSDTTKAALQKIAGIGASTSAGSFLYNPEEQLASQNLAMLTGGTPQVKSFDKNLFGLNKENIEDKVNEIKQMRLTKEATLSDIQNRLFQTLKADVHYGKLPAENPEELMKWVNTRRSTSGMRPYDSMEDMAQDLLNYYAKNPNANTKGDWQLNVYQDLLNTQKNMPKEQTLTNYLRDLYGIKEPTARDLAPGSLPIRQL